MVAIDHKLDGVWLLAQPLSKVVEVAALAKVRKVSSVDENVAQRHLHFAMLAVCVGQAHHPHAQRRPLMMTLTGSRRVATSFGQPHTASRRSHRQRRGQHHVRVQRRHHVVEGGDNKGLWCRGGGGGEEVTGGDDGKGVPIGCDALSKSLVGRLLRDRGSSFTLDVEATPLSGSVAQISGWRPPPLISDKLEFVVVVPIHHHSSININRDVWLCGVAARRFGGRSA